MRILLVEDEQDLAEPLIVLLRREGYEVSWADTLNAARSTLTSESFDLAVLDVMLVEGENAGFELAKELQASNFGGRIMFVSARDSVQDRIRGLDLGADDYLLKPFSLKEFAARTRALLRRAAPHRQPVHLGGDLI